MPYIEPSSRPEKDTIINCLFDTCNSRGDINYCCTKLVHLWALQQLEKIKCYTKKYDILNDAYGILSSAASEFYSAVVHPYEKLKREENGSVSRLDEFADGKAEDIYQCECGINFKDSQFEHVSGDVWRSPCCGSGDCKLINNEAVL